MLRVKKCAIDLNPKALIVRSRFAFVSGVVRTVEILADFLNGTKLKNHEAKCTGTQFFMEFAMHLVFFALTTFAIFRLFCRSSVNKKSPSPNPPFLTRYSLAFDILERIPMPEEQKSLESFESVMIDMIHYVRDMERMNWALTEKRLELIEDEIIEIRARLKNKSCNT